MKLSVIVPVFNEAQTVVSAISKVLQQKNVYEVIAVDDGSKDASLKMLKKIKNNKLKIIIHKNNLGKGSALADGIAASTGDYLIFQDADLEYSPSDYSRLLSKISPNAAVYGSRILSQSKHAYTRTYWGNVLITTLGNWLLGANLTDAYTCYKLIPVDIAKEMNIRARGFEVEAEITAKLVKAGVKIIEVPITYNPRTYEEGKKIKALDALKGAWMFFKISCAIM